MKSLRGLRTALLLPLSLVCACLPQATGKCSGTFLNQPVSWAIDTERTELHVSISKRYGTRYREAQIIYRRSESEQFGVDVQLGANHAVDTRSGPLEIPLTGPGPSGTMNVEYGAVETWQGYKGSPQEGYGTGHPSPPGPPRDGLVRIDGLDDSHFAGSFVYHYEDGSELTCSFDAPNRA